MHRFLAICGAFLALTAGMWVISSCAPVVPPSLPSPSVRSLPPKSAPVISANPPPFSFIHGCYVYAYKLQGRVQLNQTRFDRFNVIYLLGYPIWKAEDFLYPSGDLAVRLGGGYQYPAGDKGRALAPEFIQRAQSAGVKVLLAVQDGEFLPVCQNSAARARFVQHICDFVVRHGYDGLDIDWEEQFDLELHLELMQQFRERLDQIGSGRRLMLTTAILAGKRYPSAQASRLAGLVDWVNVMTYDLGGALYGERAFHNAGLDQVAKYAQQWSIFPPQKICLGLANYGYLYRGISPNQRLTAGALRAVGRSLSYNDLLALLAAGWQESFDPMAMAPYYFSPDGQDFATMENARSLQAKMDWIIPRGYRGVFWWEFQSDFRYASAGQMATHPLIDVVEQIIRNSSRR